MQSAPFCSLFCSWWCGPCSGLSQVEVQPFAMDVDRERAVKNLAQMVRCRTVSHDDVSLEDEAEFDKFRQLLQESYPLVHQHCEFRQVGRKGLLYRWPGKSSGDPTVFMAHYDVVPAADEDWEHPPFAGLVIDNHLWGRGTLVPRALYAP